MTSKIERALEKRTKNLIKLRLKKTLIRQIKNPINRYKKKLPYEKHIFFKNNVLLYTIKKNISMVLEIIIIKISCILQMMSRNTFPEPQPYVCFDD